MPVAGSHFLMNMSRPKMLHELASWLVLLSLYAATDTQGVVVAAYLMLESMQMPVRPISSTS